jgi:hypothetical protein
MWLFTQDNVISIKPQCLNNQSFLSKALDTYFQQFIVLSKLD